MVGAKTRRMKSTSGISSQDVWKQYGVQKASSKAGSSFMNMFAKAGADAPTNEVVNDKESLLQTSNSWRFWEKANATDIESQQPPTTQSSWFGRLSAQDESGFFPSMSWQVSNFVDHSTKIEFRS